MGHTNSTANLALPQFIGTDKPTWLGDINGAFAAIDAYAGTNDAAVSAAVSDASSAVSQASSAVNTANTANTTAGNASTAATNAVGVANTAANLAGAVDTKVGLLINLNTTDKSNIVNAINEIEGEVNPGSVSVTADGVKDAGTLLSELFALVDMSKVTAKSVLSLGSVSFGLFYKGSANIGFTFAQVGSSNVTVQTVSVASSPSYNQATITSGNVTIADELSTVPTNGVVYQILY